MRRQAGNKAVIQDDLHGLTDICRLHSSKIRKGSSGSWMEKRSPAVNAN